MKILIILFGFILLVGCNNFFQPTYNTQDFDNGIVIIETKADITIPALGKTTKYHQRAIGFSLGNGRYIALSHATSVPETLPVISSFGIIPVKVEHKNLRWIMNGQNISLMGRFEDISLFNSSLVMPQFGIFGNSDEVRVGDEIGIIGFPFAREIVVKTGIIGRVNTEKFGKKKTANCFLITAPIYPGDSGSPVLWYDFLGRRRIIGIVNACYRYNGWTQIGFAIKSNYIKRAIREILFQYYGGVK